MDNEELLTTPPQSEETIAPVTPIAPATDAPTAPPAATAPENSALVNAFERTKAQLKEIEAQNKKYKGLLEQLQANLGGTTGASSNAVELLNSFSVQEKLEAMRKDAAAQAEAKVRGETQQAIAAAKQEAEMARSSLASVRRRQSVFDFFTANGGIATEFDSFYALAGEQIDVDLSTPVAKVVKVKSSDGIQLYDDDQRPIDPAGFMVAVRSGKMGSKALQSTLTPYNQSSGVGTSPAGRTPDGKPVLDRSRIQEYVDLWHKQGLDPTKKIKEAEWR
jgi:hypothetical protein